ncbi:MAG: trypsin-like peptidase domain-containing protein [Rhizobiaceae bacterium]
MTSNCLGKLIFGRVRFLVALLSAMIIGLANANASFAQPKMTAAFEFSAPSLVHRVHVFGKDDRIELPEKYKHLREKIGLLYNSTIKYGCTATCVAPDVILTAAHCVLKAAKKKRFADTTGLKFYLWSSRVSDTRIGTDVLYSEDLIPRNVVAGYPISKTFRGSNFKQDWAYIKLRRKICGGNVLPLKPITNVEIAKAAKAGKILEVGYHGDREFGKKLLFTDNCQIKGVNLKKKRRKPPKIFNPIRHLCDLFQGASGAPMILETDSELSIVAINVAEYYQQKYLKRGRKIIKRYRKKPLYNLAVNVSNFSEYLPLLSWITIPAYEFRLTEIQKMLKEGKFYSGKLDGIFGPATWRAIRKFEKAENNPVLGLPTLEVFYALKGTTKPE